MKILIFGLVAVLCMQTIYANKTCQNKLDKLIADGLKFLENFKKEHDKDIARVETINDICNALIDYLNYYLQPTYGQNLNQEQLKTEVDTFIDGFLEQYLIAFDLLTRLQNGIYILKDLNNCLVTKYDLTCSKCSNLHGCAADYNAASCTLLSLTSEVPGAVTQALDIVAYLRKEADILAEQARELSSKYLLGCDSCVGRYLEVPVVQEFFRRFDARHDRMNAKFLILRDLCGAVKKNINEVTAAFQSLIDN